MLLLSTSELKEELLACVISTISDDNRVDVNLMFEKFAHDLDGLLLYVIDYAEDAWDAPFGVDVAEEVVLNIQC